MDIFDFMKNYKPSRPARLDRIEEEKKKRNVSRMQNRPDRVNLHHGQYESNEERARQKFDRNLQQQKRAFEKRNTPKQDLFNADGSFKDYTQELENIVNPRTYDVKELKQRKEQKQQLENLQKDIDYLKNEQLSNNLDKLTEEERNKAISSQNALNNSFVERLGNIVPKTVQSIANTVPETMDILQQVSYENIESGKKQPKLKDNIRQSLREETQANNKPFDFTDPNNYSNKLKAEQEKLNEQIYAGTNPTEQFGLQAIDSSANFIGHLLLGAITGGNALTTMTLQSGIDKTHQNLNEGYETEVALGNGLLTGALSYLTEQLPTENFYNIVNNPLGQNMLGALVSQAMEEGTEEGVEYLIEPIIDKITLGKDIDYQPNEFLMAVSLGAISGGMLGGLGMGVGKYRMSVKTQKGANQLEADINLAKDMLRSGKLSDTDIVGLQTAIPLAESTLQQYKDSSVLGDAVQLESDKPITFTQEQIEENLTKFLTPESDKLTQAQEQYAQLVQDMQNMLDLKGINMDAKQYYSLNEEGQKQIDKLQNYANQLGSKVMFDMTIDGDGTYQDGVITLNPLGKRSMTSTFIHELTHGNESSKYYAPLREFAQQYVADNFEGGWDGYIDYLSKGSYKGLAKEDIEKEATAISMQDNLASEEFIKKLIRYNGSLANRIYEEIKYLAKGGDEYSREVEHAFLQAYKDINDEDVKHEGKLQYSFGYTLDDYVNDKGIVDTEHALKFLNEVRETNEPLYEKWNDLKEFTDSHGDKLDFMANFNFKRNIEAYRNGFKNANELEKAKDNIYSSFKYQQDAIAEAEKLEEKMLNLPKGDENYIDDYNRLEYISQSLRNRARNLPKKINESLVKNFDRTNFKDTPLTNAQKVDNNHINSIEYKLNNDGKIYLVALDKSGYTLDNGYYNQQQLFDRYGSKIANDIINSINGETQTLDNIEHDTSVYNDEEFNKQVVKDAEKNFGITNNPSEVGYTTIDGKWLDFSDKKNSGGTTAGQRIVDHYEVGDYENFVRMGNIRMFPETGGFELFNMPNEKQQKALLKFLKSNEFAKNEGSFIGITSDPTKFGRYDVASLQFESDVPAEERLEKALSYFDDVQYSKGETLRTDADGNNLTDQQINYLKDSKVRDEQGRLIPMYHGTDKGGFTKFDVRLSEDGTSIFLTSNPDIAETYGNDIDYSKYGNLDKQTLLNQIKNKNRFGLSIEENEKGYQVYQTTKDGNKKATNGLYGATLEELQQKLQNKGLLQNTYKVYVDIKNPLQIDLKNKRWNQISYDDIYNALNDVQKSQLDNAISDLFNEDYPKSRTYLTKEVSMLAKQLGFDGTIIDNVYATGKEGNYESDVPTTIVSVFDSNQVKDINNLNPTLNDDIRYSKGESLKKHEEAVEDYGAFEKGEKPFRDVDIAKETDKGKTRQFTRTIAEAEVTSDEDVERLKADIGEGKYAYQPISNKERIEKAQAKFKDMDIEEAVDSVLNAKKFDAQTLAEGEVLMSMVGDNPKLFDKLSSSMAVNLTEIAQTLQASRILKTLTPAGRVLHAKKTIAKIQEKVNQTHGKNAPNIELNPELQAKLEKANGIDEINKIEEEIVKDAWEQVPPTFMDKLNAWRYLSMLGNPRTHIRNIVGNSVFYPLGTIKNTIATAIEETAEKTGLLKNRTKSFSNRKSDKELYDFANSVYKEVKEGKTIEKAKYGDLSQNRDVFKSKFLNKASELNSQALENEDIFFSKPRFAQSLVGYMKANKLTPADTESEAMAKAYAYALKESQKQTFNDMNALANWINSGSKNKGVRFFTDAVLPFKRTPMNIVKRGIEYSPVGLATTLGKAVVDSKNGTFNANEFIDGLASGLTGSMIAGLGYFLASIGMFRTKDDDKDKKQNFDKDNGEQNYAIQIGNSSYTLDWASPSIIPLSVGAKLYENDNSFGSLDDFISVAEGIADPIFETTMLGDLTKSIKSYSQDESGYIGDLVSSAITSYIKQFVPTIAGQIARTIDGTRRTTYPNSGTIDKTYKEIKGKIPFVSMTNEPYINKQGKEEKAEDLGMGLLGRAFLNMVSPGFYKSKDIDKYDEELYRLYDQTNELGTLPSSFVKQFKFEGTDYKFNGKESTAYHKKRYADEMKYVNEFIDSEMYKSLDDSQRAKVIKDMRTYSGYDARNEYLKTKGTSDTNKEYLEPKEALEHGIPLYQYYGSKAYMNSLEGDNKKTQYIDYLDNENLSSEAKNYLYDVQYGDSKLTELANDMDISDEKKFEIKKTSDIVSDVDENGDTIRGSKGGKVKEEMVKDGTYNDVIEYMYANGLEPKNFGLTKDVVKNDYHYVTPNGATEKSNYSSKTYKAKQRQIKNLVKAIAKNQNDYYKAIDKILVDYVYNDAITDKTIAKIQKKYMTAGMKDLIDDYLKDHPFADKSLLGL